MSQPPETRVCPICHSLLWEEDFLRPEDLETWELESRVAGNGTDPESDLLELAELLLELFLTLDVEE